MYVLVSFFMILEEQFWEAMVGFAILSREARIVRCGAYWRTWGFRFTWMKKGWVSAYGQQRRLEFAALWL